MSEGGTRDRAPGQRAQRRDLAAPTPESGAGGAERPRPARPREAIFGLEDVQVSYGPKPAVRGVSFDIGKNEITALIGPSGCGKSTLIRCLNRMNDLIPGARVEGKVLYHGQDLYAPDGRRGRGAQADRHGLPEAEPVPQVDLRQHRLRPARARHEGRHGRDRRARARAGRALGRGQGPPQDERLRHVRRPAAAPLHRALPGGRPRRDPDGRALLGARPDLHREDRGPDARAQAASTRS